MNICWCSNSLFSNYVHPEYATCDKCGTAVLKNLPRQDNLVVNNDTEDLYGFHYWEEHQTKQGYSSFNERARFDLSGRNQYWLKYLLKYSVPPGKTLEVGCGPGSFVKLMQLAGYDSIGMEMSPSIIKKSKEIFNINVLQGPIENCEANEKYDLLLMFDVIEHFADPLKSLRQLTHLLNPNGMIVIQTPNLDLCKSINWIGFKVPEHTFLFTQQSLTSLLKSLGFGYFSQEPACFWYDQFIFFSRNPINHIAPSVKNSALEKSAEGRIILAMQDLYEANNALNQRFGGGKRLLKELAKTVMSKFRFFN